MLSPAKAKTPIFTIIIANGATVVSGYTAAPHSVKDSAFFLRLSTRALDCREDNAVVEKTLILYLLFIFRANLAIVKDLGDRAAQGRACGNLGNTHYLLGNFELAIMFHEEVSEKGTGSCFFFLPQLADTRSAQNSTEKNSVMYLKCELWHYWL